MLNREVIMEFFYWLLGVTQEPEAKLVPIREDDYRTHRQDPRR